MKKKITLLFLTTLIIFNVFVFLSGKNPAIINLINILFHEAGHWIYSIFGSFVGGLGGFLGEITMPLLFLFYFKRRKDLPAQVFSLWWLSTAFYGTSIYIADARARVLTLISEHAIHDWAYILGRLDLLSYDLVISRVFVLIALLITFYMAVLLYSYKNIIHVE